MTLGYPQVVLNRLIAALAMVMLLLAAPIIEGAIDSDHSHDVPAVEQTATKSAANSAACHGATICNLVLNQFEAHAAIQLTVKDASNPPFETVFHANRSDEFDTPPPRTVFFVT